jgi:hypothetical protein
MCNASGWILSSYALGDTMDDHISVFRKMIEKEGICINASGLISIFNLQFIFKRGSVKVHDRKGD